MALALAVFGAGAAAPDATPDLATIRAAVEKARGTPPRSELTVVNFTAGGLQGTRVELSSNDGWRETVRFGPFVTATGTYRGQSWYQNANGETVLEQPEPEDALPDTAGATVSRVTEPFPAFVLSNLNARGFGTKEYVDPATWRIVRIDDVGATETATTLYDDFRTIDGYTRPWHWTVSDGHPEDDREYRIGSDGATVLAAGALAVPPSRRNLVEFPAGVSQTALPVRTDDAQFIVRVNVGSRGLDFLLDTGASGIVIDDDVARSLGLELFAPSSNAANAGRYLSERAIVPEMRVGDLTMRDVAVSTIPHFGADYPADYKIVGLLGFDFIGSLSLKLDYERGRVTAYDPATFAPPADPMTNVLDVRFRSGEPLTGVTVNDALGERFIVDTGSQSGVMIFDYFARRYPHALVNTGGFQGEPPEMYGVGGRFPAKQYVLKDVRVGNVDFRDFTAYLVTSPRAYSGNIDGVIGTNFLRLFDVYTDYDNSRIYLVPTPRTKRVMK